MAQKLKFGNGTWATKEGSTLAYNDENENYKPLPFSFERDSIATRVNKEGLIEVVGNNIPRIDYTDSADGVLLLEPSRTNYIYPSINLSNWANFSAGGTITVTDNYAISPDGTQNASRIEMSGGNAVQWTYQNVSNLGTFASFYVKSTNSNNQDFRWFWNNGSEGVDLVATSEWQRFEVSVSQSSSLPMGFTTHSNLSSSDILVYGVQVEQSSYATSYIPTSDSTVPRAAETANGSGNSEVFNDSEGVLFANTATLQEGVTEKIISLSDGTTSNNIYFSFSGTANTIYSLVISGGSTQASLSTTVSQIQPNKLLIKYKSNDISFWLNGFKVGFDTSANTPSGLKNLSFSYPTNAINFYGKTKEVGYYDTALTDEELEYLTSYRSLNELVTELNLNTL